MTEQLAFEKIKNKIKEKKRKNIKSYRFRENSND